MDQFIQNHRWPANVTSQMIHFPHKPLLEDLPDERISFDQPGADTPKRNQRDIKDYQFSTLTPTRA